MQIIDFFWKQLTDYHLENDTYKDGNDKGLLVRYLSIFGIELQNEVVDRLENIINELDPHTASNEFLSEIAYAVGRPSDILLDIDRYRILLTQIISIYQIKGTAPSYRLLFNLLGMSVDIIEHFPDDVVYDNDIIYDDDGGDAVVYDETKCEIGCIDYSLVYDNNPGFNVAPLSPQLEANLKLMIQDFIEPIDCNIRAMIYQP